MANLSLDKDVPAVGDSKKRMELVVMKAAVEHLEETFAFSERRACPIGQPEPGWQMCLQDSIFSDQIFVLQQEYLG